MPGPGAGLPSERLAADGDGVGDSAGMLAAVLDCLGLGVLLVNESLAVRYANRAARLRLSSDVQPVGADLALPWSAVQQERLRPAVRQARVGHWSMLMISHADRAVPVGVVPLPADRPWRDVAALLLLGGSSQPGGLARQFFCQQHGLTAAEGQVFQALSDGLAPEQIALQAGVALCTVRTHIAAIRAKANATSVRHLMQMVASLPPLLGATASASL